MATETVPTIEEFRPAVLSVLRNGTSLSFGELCTEVAETMGLPEDVKEQKIPSGQARYKNRVGWACSGLKHAGLVTQPKHGWYEITDDGRTVAEQNLSSYSDQQMKEWPIWRAYQDEIAERKAKTPPVENSGPSVGPVEAIETAAAELNAKVETELRKELQASSPAFFEKAVIQLLWAMGYGGTHGEKKHVGTTGDGGIDGIINQDALGLQKVCVQAKRYKDGNNIGADAIRNFYGALKVRSAEKGVSITTSKFTQEAKKTAESYAGDIVLIDGIRLTSLMLEYGVAVQVVQTFSVYEVDEDFFETEL